MKVRDLKIRKILATNSKETIEIELKTDKGIVTASVPMGTSKGKYEVKCLPIETVIKSFSLIKKNFLNKKFSTQEEVDYTLKSIDNTKNFSSIGGNLALGISSACLKGFALEKDMKLFEFLGGKRIPKPLCNFTGGWEKSEIQEFLVFPKSQKSFSEEIFKISKLYLEFGKVLEKTDKNFRYSKNYESAWVTFLESEKILELLSKLTKNSNLLLGLDIAGNYNKRNTNEQREFISELIRNYGIKYVEDPFGEDDFESFAWLREKFNDVLVCGDDLFATNIERLKLGIERKAANAIIIKPNQIGTITDVNNVIEEAKKNGMTTVISHRSGETENTLICHLGVGFGCDMAKIGISGERTVKINEFLRIEDSL